MTPVVEVALRGNRDEAGRATHAFRPAEVSVLEPRLVLSTASLSPPWYTYRNAINATVGKDPGVAVSPLIPVGNTGSYYVNVVTNNTSRGVALASVLAPLQDFGGVFVATVVTNSKAAIYLTTIPTNAYQLASLENTAFAGNRLYAGVKVAAIAPGQPLSVFPIFTKTVVQFPNDNLADYYQNFNAVTADVFSGILNTDVNGIIVDPSTVSTVKHK